MSDPSPRGDLRRLAASAGKVVAAFGVFLGAWLTFRPGGDWRLWILGTAVAIGSAVAASAFARMERSR